MLTSSCSCSTWWWSAARRWRRTTAPPSASPMMTSPSHPASAAQFLLWTGGWILLLNYFLDPLGSLVYSVYIMSNVTVWVILLLHIVCHGQNKDCYIDRNGSCGSTRSRLSAIIAPKTKLPVFSFCWILELTDLLHSSKLWHPWTGVALGLSCSCSH